MPVGEFNAQPYEILGVPFEIWEAPVGTTFPLVTEDPATLSPTPWTLVGTSGKLNYTDDGVTIQHTETVEKFRGADTAVRKSWRTEEDLMISATIADLKLEQYARALNFNTVTDIPGGSANTSKIGLSKGAGIATRALLVRGPSPYMDGGVAQYEVPLVSVESSTEVTTKKGVPAALKITWTAYADPDAASADERYGRLVAQTDDAS